MPERYEVRKFTADLTDAAAGLLAARHRQHRQAVPALDPAYESVERCAQLIAETLNSEGVHGGAVAFRGGKPAGYVLFTRRDPELWGPNAWAEDTGNAGEAEAIRECYAFLAGDLVNAGIRGHWAMVPASDSGLIDAWFSVSFGVQQCYAWRPPVGTDFEPRTPDHLVIRRPTVDDVHALAQLDVVLPNHVSKSPVFSNITIPSVEEAESELADDINNPNYSIWVAEHEGRIVSELIGVNVEESGSWAPIMKPASAALLGYGATFPDARGLGAGRALTDVFMAWARDAGYEWLVTDWRSGNLEANRTWRAMGFRPHFLRLYRHIP